MKKKLISILIILAIFIGSGVLVFGQQSLPKKGIELAKLLLKTLNNGQLSYNSELHKYRNIYNYCPSNLDQFEKDISQIFSPFQGKWRQRDDYDNNISIIEFNYDKITFYYSDYNTPPASGTFKYYATEDYDNIYLLGQNIKSPIYEIHLFEENGDYVGAFRLALAIEARGYKSIKIVGTDYIYNLFR